MSLPLGPPWEAVRPRGASVRPRLFGVPGASCPEHSGLYRAVTRGPVTIGILNRGPTQLRLSVAAGFFHLDAHTLIPASSVLGLALGSRRCLVYSWCFRTTRIRFKFGPSPLSSRS